MTKRRSALTAQKALTTIAGLIGWDRCCAITGKADRTIRNWSEPDTSAGITLENALKLDVAYAEAGGDGAPFATWYQARLQMNVARACATARGRAKRAARAAKEAGEALAAQIIASAPGATAADRAIAKRETEQCIEAMSHILPDLDLCPTEVTE